MVHRRLGGQEYGATQHHYIRQLSAAGVRLVLSSYAFPDGDTYKYRQEEDGVYRINPYGHRDLGTVQISINHEAPKLRIQNINLGGQCANLVRSGLAPSADLTELVTRLENFK